MIVYDTQVMRQAASAILAIDELGQLPELIDWISAAKRERRQANPTGDSDRNWRLRDPLSYSRQLGEKLAALTGVPTDLCISAVTSEADPDGSEAMLDEVIQFLRYLRQQPRFEAKLPANAKRAAKRKQQAERNLYGGRLKEAT